MGDQAWWRRWRISPGPIPLPRREEGRGALRGHVSLRSPRAEQAGLAAVPPCGVTLGPRHTAATDSGPTPLRCGSCPDLVTAPVTLPLAGHGDGRHPVTRRTLPHPAPTRGAKGAARIPCPPQLPARRPTPQYPARRLPPLPDAAAASVSRSGGLRREPRRGGGRQERGGGGGGGDQGREPAGDPDGLAAGPGEEPGAGRLGGAGSGGAHADAVGGADLRRRAVTRPVPPNQPSPHCPPHPPPRSLALPSRSRSAAARGHRQERRSIVRWTVPVWPLHKQ